MTKEEDKLTQQAWELLCRDLSQSRRLEDALRDGRMRLLTDRANFLLRERQLKIGDAVLAKLRKP
jgi:hypothetical protein